MRLPAFISILLLGGLALETLAAESLLEACWSPEALRVALPTDRIQSHRPADHAPPERQVPSQRPPPLATHHGSIRSVLLPDGEKLLALTFDLCERSTEITGYDARIIDLLREEDVAATFYAGGKWMRSHPERTQQLMADPRFEIGNHAWTHGNLRVLRGQDLADQILWTQAEYERLREQLLARPCAQGVAPSQRTRIPPVPATFRFPFGACDKVALDAVAEAGLSAIQWDVVSGDPVRDQSAERMAEAVLARVRPGSIVIAHANRRGWQTAEALAILIPALRERGYRFVTVSELLRAGEPVSVETCYELEPGDNLHYDQLFGAGTE